MKVDRIDAIERCKYFSREQGCRNGRSCVYDEDNPARCMPWFYDTECEKFEEKNNEDS